MLISQPNSEAIAGQLVKIGLPVYLYCLRGIAPRKASLEWELYQLCRESGISWERMFAHYGTITPASSSLPHNVPQEAWGRCSAAGAIVSLSTGWQSLDSAALWNVSMPDSTQADVFPLGVSAPADDQVPPHYTYGLYIASPEPFRHVIFTLRTPGAGRIFGPLIAYPTEVSVQYEPLRWSYAAVLGDGTAGFTQSGTITFQADIKRWKRSVIPALVKDYGIHLHESPLYWVRVLASFTQASPRVRGIRLTSWVSLARTGDALVCVNMGWRDENDADGDGYLSDAEFQQLQYPMAQARWKYYARVGLPLNLPGIERQYPGWFLARIWDETVAELIAEACSLWLEQPRGYRGVILSQPYQPPGGPSLQIATGGVLMDGFSADPVQSNQFREGLLEYGDQLLKAVRRARPARSWVFLRRERADRPYTSGVIERSTQSCDGQIVRTVPEHAGMFGVYGVCRDWDHQAMAEKGRTTIFIMDCILPFLMGHTEEWWKRALTAAWCQYLLRYIPGRTAVLIQPQNLNPASTRLTTQGTNYYKSNVPISMAYLPDRMMSVPIGVPSSIPSGYQPVPLVNQTESGWNQSSVIGNSQSTSVQVVLEGQTVLVNLVPSNVFVLYPQSGWQSGLQDVVIARAFTAGLVLYRCKPITPESPNDPSYVQSELTVSLPSGSYRQILFDGSLGQPTTQATLRGWQGMVMLKVS